MQRCYTIKITDFQFNPSEICIPPGSMVRWYVDPSFNAQEDEFLISGTFIPDDSYDSEINFESKALNWGDEYTETFSKCGRIDYFDSTYSFMQGTIQISFDSRKWNKCDKYSTIEKSEKYNNSSIKHTPPSQCIKERKSNISPLSQLSKPKSLSLYGSFDIHSSSSSLLIENKNTINRSINKPIHPLFGSFSQYKSIKNEEKNEINNKSIIESFTLPFITSISSANQEIQKNHKKKKKSNRKKKNKRKRNNSKSDIRNEKENEIEDYDNDDKEESNQNIKLTFSNYDSILLIDDRIEPFEVVNNTSDFISPLLINKKNEKMIDDKFKSFLVSRWNREISNINTELIITTSDCDDIYELKNINNLCSFLQ